MKRSKKLTAYVLILHVLLVVLVIRTKAAQHVMHRARSIVASWQPVERPPDPTPPPPTQRNRSMAWTDYRLTTPESGSLISEWQFAEGSGTTVDDAVGSSNINLATPTDPNYTWTARGISLASGLVQTPSITGARTVVMLCRVGKGEETGFILSGGSASGSGHVGSTASTTATVHTGFGRAVVPLYRRVSSGQHAWRLNRGNWYLLITEFDTAYTTILGMGGRHSTTTSRCTEFEIAWAAVFSSTLTDGERKRIYYMARQLASSRSFYIDYRDCPTQADVVAIWGQSNAEGRAKIVNLSAGDQANTTPANVYISTKNTLTTAALEMGVNQQVTAPSTDFGPEMGIAWQAETAGQTLYISTYAVGSTYLADTAAQDWSLDEIETSNLFNFALRNLWTVEADMLNAGVGPRLRGLAWMQGEQDATNATYGAAYGDNLRALIAKYREQVGDPAAPVSIGRIRDEDPTFNAAAVADVRKYQEIVGSADAASSWIDTDAMTLKVDNVHYDAAGMKSLGEAFYEDLLATESYADAADVRLGVDRGDGTTGTCAVPTAAQVLNGVSVDATTGTVVLPAAGDVQDGVTFGPSSGTTGTLELPTASQVLNAVGFGAAGTEFTGNVVLPPTHLVIAGETYGANSADTGTLVSPSAEDTASAVRTELTNELGRLDVAVSSRVSSAGYGPQISGSFNLLTGLTSGSGTLADDANEAIAAAVAAESTIAAKLALIGTGSATVSTPVADDGQITSAIIIGDDYLAANGRAFTWTIDEITGITAATASCQFGASHDRKGSFLVTGTITDNGSTWTLSFDVTRTDTADCEKGEYDWSVQVTDASGNELTRVRNATDCYKVQLVEKQT